MSYHPSAKALAFYKTLGFGQRLQMCAGIPIVFGDGDLFEDYGSNICGFYEEEGKAEFERRIEELRNPKEAKEKRTFREQVVKATHEADALFSNIKHFYGTVGFDPDTVRQAEAACERKFQAALALKCCEFDQHERMASRIKQLEEENAQLKRQMGGRNQATPIGGGLLPVPDCSRLDLEDRAWAWRVK